MSAIVVFLMLGGANVRSHQPPQRQRERSLYRLFGWPHYEKRRGPLLSISARLHITSWRAASVINYIHVATTAAAFYYVSAEKRIT